MDYKQKAQEWLASDKVSEADKAIIRAADDAKLFDMFGADIEFGTAGLRGELGPGTNRLNPLVVRRATVGMAHFVLNTYGEEGKRRGVAVSFDNRHMSEEFSREVCAILNAYGINTFSFACPHPTPELSYTVRECHCVAGVMITASHNPAKYNGYKVYDETGDQMVYENIDNLVREISNLPGFLDVVVEPAEVPGVNTVLGENFDKRFVDREASTSILNTAGQISSKHVKIVLTPQCGTNVFLGPWSLRECGYEVTSVPGQDRWDGDFDGVEFPNPEFDCAWVKAEKLLMELHEKDPAYTIAICNDPDADRVGLGFIGRDGKFHRYTGNQTGALLIDFILGERQRQGNLPADGVVYNSFVTSAFGATVAEKKYGMTVKWVPTGFKYIGYAIEHSEAPFMFGYEESYGYLTKEFVRDKDCLQSNIAIADMAEDCYRKGITIDERFAQLEASGRQAEADRPAGPDPQGAHPDPRGSGRRQGRRLPQLQPPRLHHRRGLPHRRHPLAGLHQVLLRQRLARRPPLGHRAQVQDLLRDGRPLRRGGQGSGRGRDRGLLRPPGSLDRSERGARCSSFSMEESILETH